MGYSKKNPHPHDGRHGFLTPHPPGFPKLLEPPSPQDFQVQRIKLLDAVILLYTQCRRILLGT